MSEQMSGPTTYNRTGEPWPAGNIPGKERDAVLVALGGLSSSPRGGVHVRTAAPGQESCKVTRRLKRAKPPWVPASAQASKPLGGV